MMLEKGKGLVLSKLHIIQLIEADLQLIIRIYTNMRNKYKIKDYQTSKSNFISWLNYSIDIAIFKMIYLQY